MFGAIQPLDIYNKNINILIGLGASADLFPTLSSFIYENSNIYLHCTVPERYCEILTHPFLFTNDLLIDFSNSVQPIIPRG